MNKRQAKRIALAVNASYLLNGADTYCVTGNLSEADIHRYSEAQNEMAWDMLRRAGFDRPMSADEIMAVVLDANT